MKKLNLRKTLSPIYPQLRHAKLMSKHLKGRLLSKRIRKTKIENAFEKIETK